MAYQRRSFNLVSQPAMPDPLQSLSSMMSLASNMEGYQDQRRQRDDAKRVEEAFAQARGNPEAAADLLEQQGAWAPAQKLRANAGAIRQQAIDQGLERVNQYKTLYGQGAQFLREVDGKPDLYGGMRPKLVELAGAVDPRLAQEIPETYDPERIRGMLQFTEGAAAVAETQANGLAKLKEAQTATDDAVKRRRLHQSALADWLSTAKSAEDWQGVTDGAYAMGIPEETIAEFGPWAPDAPERARQMALTPAQRAPKEDAPPTTFAAAILRARAKGDAAEVKGLMALQQRITAAGREPRAALDPSAVQAVLKNPTIWGDLTPDMRGQMLVPLSKAGFDFGAAAKGLTEAQKQTIERWRTDEISRLNRDRRNPSLAMTDEDYAAEQQRIEASYNAQLGASPPTAADPTRPPRTATGDPRDIELAPAAPAPTTDKTVSMADLQAIARRRGTTVDQERERARAAGYELR